MNNITTIDTEDLSVAAKQLWQLLEPAIQYLPQNDRDIVELAFLQMVEAHKEQRRKSGQFYIIHPVSACLMLANIGLDRDTLAACLMHDVPEDTEVSLRQLSKTFSKEIIFLISGITKLSVIKYKGEDRYAENLRRMFVAMSQDLRVIFIKLADRLHNLKTLKALPQDKAHRIALESLEIYVPIAERLGINFFKNEIEDAAFPYVYPDQYKQFLALSNLEIKKRVKQVERIKKKTKQILDQEKIPYHNVLGRAKKYYSLFKKMQDQAKSIEEVYDLVALRIITDTVDNCYHTLSLLHTHFDPMEGRVKDYIDKPKSNGYQSIHTTVKDKQLGTIFEFQIRTQEMHDYAEYGVAAHWAYKVKGVEETQFLDPERLKWISGLVGLGKQHLSEQEYLKYVKLDLFKGQIFVMTPKGDVINLPEGSTPLDFAYKIHEQIAQHTVLAKVNGNAIKLSEPLQNGDVVEILTAKKQKPTSGWLQWVKTNNAARHIRAFLRREKVK